MPTAKSNLDKVTGYIQNAAAIEGRPISKDKAFRLACDENPYLHERYLIEHNESHLEKSLGRK